MKDKYNVVLITIDAWRYDHCGFNGYPRDVTPRIDRLARKAAVFDEMYATGPCTPPSFCSMFTATFPFDRGGFSPLPPWKVTIAEVLSRHGYQTAGFTSNPQNSHYFNYHRGFRRFFDSLGASSKNPVTRQVLAHFERSGRRSNALYNRLQSLKLFPDIVQASLKRLFYRLFLGRSVIYYVRARGITRRALKWFWYHYHPGGPQGGPASKPFFLWAHYMDTHDPFIPRWSDLAKVNPRFNKKEFDYVKRFPEYTDVLKLHKRRRSLVDLYDAELRAVDERVGFFVRKFKRKGAFDSTIFFLTSDHGEEFGEHGDFGHRAHLHNELLHVPFMVFGGPVERGEIPGLGAGTRVGSTFSLGQLAPTVLDVLGIPRPASFDMASMMPHLAPHGDEQQEAGGASASFPARHVMACTLHKGIQTRFNELNDRAIKRMASIQGFDFKYLLDMETGSGTLYDLRADPSEKRDVSASYPDLSERCKVTCMEYLRGNGRSLVAGRGATGSTGGDGGDGGGERRKIAEAISRLKARL
ncbi:MAG: sulfatase [Candidatus Lokiarchaeota archaeon]|nr:sulfatase [Candidatus Lokiarchaeota archaeon]